jgi:ribosome-binding protein aMBF1 (putative translation factor)
MGFSFVDPDTYHRYKDRVLELSNAVQVNYQEHLPAERRRPALSDEQIAEKLGIEADVVREIRCVAERDKYGLDEFEAAIRFKDEACRAFAKRGISAVMAPHVQKAKAKKG